MSLSEGVVFRGTTFALSDIEMIGNQVMATITNSNKQEITYCRLINFGILRTMIAWYLNICKSLLFI